VSSSSPRPSGHLSTLFACAVVALVALGGPRAQAQDVLPPGAFLPDGMSIDLTKAGLAKPIELLVEGIPPELVIGTTPGQELINLLLCSEDLQVQNLTVFTEFQTATVSASAAGMFLDVDMALRVNSSTNPAWVVLDGCFDFECFLYTDPATLLVELPMQLALVPGQERIDLQLGPLSQNIGWLVENRVHFGGCPLIDINEYLVENWGLDLIDFVIDELIDTLENELDGMLIELETTVEDALTALWLEDTLELGNAVIHYQIEPTAVEHTNAGLRLKLGGSVEPLVMDPCVDRFDPGGSPWTPSQLPELQGFIPTTSLGYDASIVLSDDLPNQALWSLWRAGALCFEASELGGSPLTTTLLGVMLGPDLLEEMEGVLGVGAPMLVRVVPERVPEVRYDGDFPVRLEVPELHVEFWADVLDRPTRLASITGDLMGVVDASIDSTGALVFDIALQNEELRERVTYNEFFPALDAELASALPGLIDLAIGSLLGIELAGGVAPLPTLLGFGLDSMWLQPSGDFAFAPDHVGAYVTVGPSDGGGDIACESAGCEAMDGCATADGCAAAQGCEAGGEGLLGGGCALPEEGGCDAQDLVIQGGCTGELGTSTDEGCRIGPPRLRIGTMDAVVFSLLLLWRRRRR